MNNRLTKLLAVTGVAVLAACGQASQDGAPNGQASATAVEMSQGTTLGNSLSKPAAPGTTTLAATTATATTSATSGRLLASNCFACHGTNGVPSGGFERLAGMSAQEIVSELKEFRTKTDGGIMKVHSLGFSDQQIWELAAFFAPQR